MRNGHALIGIIDRVLADGVLADAPVSLLPEHKKLMGDMRSWVQTKATELNVDPALLASRREIESFILTPDNESLPDRFLGWRKDVITDRLVELKENFS